MSAAPRRTCTVCAARASRSKPRVCVCLASFLTFARISTPFTRRSSSSTAARALPGIKKILFASGLRYDLAIRSPEYVKELVQHHVGGYLKIAPEHTEQGPLSK